MSEDPIVAEVRRVRDEQSARHDYDLRKIFDSLKQREKQEKGKLVSYPPRLAKPVKVGTRDESGPDD